MKLEANQFCQIEYFDSSHLLIFSWLPDSKNLDENEVKSEILKILHYLEEYSIESIIVDSRHYAFRENYQIQNWINNEFMPQIIESPVSKYAIIVALEKLNELNKGFDEENEVMEELQVQYFSSLETARAWIL